MDSLNHVRQWFPDTISFSCKFRILRRLDTRKPFSCKLENVHLKKKSLYLNGDGSLSTNLLMSINVEIPNNLII